MQSPLHRDRFIVISSICVILLSALVLAGWALEIQALKSILPHYITMKANTAVGLLLFACALYFSRNESLKRWQLIATTTFCGAGFLIGILTLTQYFTGSNFGIDEFFFADSDGAGGKSRPSCI